MLHSPLHAYAHVLLPALEYAGGSHTLEDVADAVQDGRMQFWPGTHSAIVTQIEQSPRRKVVHFFLAGGDMAELEAMTPIILEWAQTTQGCDGATLAGRRGWQRSFLAKQGWETHAVVMGLNFSTPE